MTESFPTAGPAALLPNGFVDTLPPAAAHEQAVIDGLVRALTLNGYDRVKPPLVEFEDSLLSGPGAALAQSTFRLMDPISQRMMGIRADMTVQVARIALNRLARAQRPLRLCYAGQVLRVRGSQLRPERQFAQVGAELIGPRSATADAEVIGLAIEALQAIGVPNLSLDLTLPTLVPMLLSTVRYEAEALERLRHAIDRKDTAGVAATAGPLGDSLVPLLTAAGPWQAAFEAIADLAFAEAPARAIERLREVVERVRTTWPEVALTLDFTENRGFEYQTGVAFTAFARGVRGELGRGGRYIAQRSVGANDDGEPATGFSLFLDSILRAVPEPRTVAKLYLPAGIPAARARALRAEGHVTVAGLEPVDDPLIEADRLGCGHVLIDDVIRPVPG